MSERKVSERMRVMVREMLKEIRHDSRFNVMDYDSVDHLLTAIAEIEQRGEKWKEVAVAYQKWRDTYADDIADARLVAAIAALGDEWEEVVR